MPSLERVTERSPASRDVEALLRGRSPYGHRDAAVERGDVRAAEREADLMTMDGHNAGDPQHPTDVDGPLDPDAPSDERAAQSPLQRRTTESVASDERDARRRDTEPQQERAEDEA